MWPAWRFTENKQEKKFVHFILGDRMLTSSTLCSYKHYSTNRGWNFMNNEYDKILWFTRYASESLSVSWYINLVLNKAKINKPTKKCWHESYIYIYIYIYTYRVSQEECARLWEGVPYVKVYRYNPKHLCPKLNGYGDDGQRSLKLWQLLHTYWLPNTY